MKILLLGPQGSGKGTVGKMLAERLGIPIFGTGDLLRALPENHPRYIEITDLVNSGALAPQDFVAELIRERVSCNDCTNGYIMEGWGRSRIDLEIFDPEYDKVLVFNISRETSIKRITGRRICSSNGKTYNIFTLPKEMLNECTGELVLRDDDTEEAVNLRLDIYYSKTVEVIEDFRKKGVLLEIEAEDSPEEVLKIALKALEIE